VVYFACLRESEAASYIPSGAGPSVLTEPAVLPLAEYLSQHIDALLVVNSYGDAQTSLLLDVVQAMKRAAAGESLASAEDSASLRDWHAPLVIMDLPNLSLPKHWNGKLDGFIAPSKAAALHYDTIAHSKSMCASCDNRRTKCAHFICKLVLYREAGGGDLSPSAGPGHSVFRMRRGVFLPVPAG
jgi:hypothetical protein